MSAFTSVTTNTINTLNGETTIKYYSLYSSDTWSTTDDSSNATVDDTTTKSTNPPPTSLSPDDGLTGGAIAGIVIAVLVLIACIAVAAFFIVKRKLNHAKPMKKASRKKWSQFFHRLTNHNKQRRPTAPSLDELRYAEHNPRHGEHADNEIQPQQQDNRGYEAGDEAIRLPKVAQKPQHAPDIHITVDPHPPADNLDIIIPSPDNLTGPTTSGPHYDFPHKSTRIVEGEDDAPRDDIYDHPQNQFDYNKNSESGFGEVDGEMEDIYDTPKSNNPIDTDRKPPPVFKEVMSPSPREQREKIRGNTNLSDEVQDIEKEKHDYENLSKWHPGPPPERVLDISQMVPPPPADEHKVGRKPRYVNIPEVEDFMTGTLTNGNAEEGNKATDGSGDRRLDEDSSVLDGTTNQYDDGRKDGDEITNNNTIKDSHDDDKMPPYENVKGKTPYYVNSTTLLPGIHDHTSNEHSSDEEYVNIDGMDLKDKPVN